MCACVLFLLALKNEDFVAYPFPIAPIHQPQEEIFVSCNLVLRPHTVKYYTVFPDNWFLSKGETYTTGHAHLFPGAVLLLSAVSTDFETINLCHQRGLPTHAHKCYSQHPSHGFWPWRKGTLVVNGCFLRAGYKKQAYFSNPEFTLTSALWFVLTVHYWRI